MVLDAQFAAGLPSPSQTGRFSAKAKSSVRCSHCIPDTCVTYSGSGVPVSSVLRSSWEGGKESGGMKDPLHLYLKNKLGTNSSLPVWTVALNTRNEEVQGTKFSTKRSKK